MEGSVATFDLDVPTEETWHARLRAANRVGHPWLVVEDEQGVAGYATASEFRPKRAYRTTVESTIYLRPGTAGRGLGTVLYGALMDALDAGEFRVAIALITLPNDPSVGLHEKLGFTRTGVLPEVGFKHDAWRDVGIWLRQRPAPRARAGSA